MRKVWIEVALNGAWSRRLQPGIPDTVDEIVAQGIACVRAGASIAHVHAYLDGGRQTFDWQVYARIIEGIRARVDALVYPSYPAAEAGDTTERFAHVEALAERGLLEFAVVDPGSVNFTLATTSATRKPAETYLNPEADVRRALAFAAARRLHPAYAIYEPGFTRAGAALARALQVPAPVYRFMFSETFAFGFPATPYGLEAHVALLDDVAPGAAWMVAGLAVDIRPLIEPAVRRGGHVRVGLEDAPLGSTMSNLDWVEDAARRVAAAGGAPATAAEVRQALAALA